MSVTIRFEGLDEFMRNIEAIADQYPQTAEKHLRRVGNRLRRKVIQNTPMGKTDEEYKKEVRHGFGNYEVVKRRSKIKLKNSWTAKVVNFRGHSLAYQLRSKSRRFHLVERGHVKVTPGGQVRGFVQGRFFFKNAVDEFTSGGEIRKQMEKFMREIQRKAGG